MVDHVVAAELAGEDAVGVLLEAAVEVLVEDPEQAGEWLDRARQAGGERGQLAAPAAVAAFARGRVDEALAASDDVPLDASGPDRTRAATVRAAVLGGRGLWSAALADLAAVSDDPAAAAHAAVAAVGAGDRLRARTLLEDASPAGSLAAAAARGAARHLVDGVQGDLDLTGFADAAELAERRPLGPAALTPHALGVVVATAAGELTVARDLAERAVRHGVGGPAHERRHRLLLGWVGLREGRWDVVEATLADPVPDEEPTPQAVLAAALEAGLARRAGDLQRLITTWERAEPLLLRQPVSPFAVEPTAELVICAHRLGTGTRVASLVVALEEVSADLPLWAMVLDWLLLQAAVAAEDSDAVAARARAVGTRPAPGPRLEALAPAASAWLAVLAGEVHEDQVTAAADGLVDAGLVWEASRLVGQAAIRTTDGGLARALLERARDVKGLLPAERDPDAAPTAAPPSVLSERELEVGTLVLDGLTHKEIGAQLYISPKTVEHHVAKIRQKLGVSTRAELLVALRGVTGP
jgi:DNA-binding CsgD family transcriptional regulator